MFVGIDVAKDRLDVHVRPAGEAFTVAREDARPRAAGLQGYRSTIVTSGLGLGGTTSPMTTALKTLLEQ